MPEDATLVVLKTSMELLGKVVGDVLSSRQAPAGVPVFNPAEYTRDVMKAMQDGIELGRKLAAAETPAAGAIGAGSPWLGLADRLASGLDRYLRIRERTAAAPGAPPAPAGEKLTIHVPAWVPRVIADGIPRLIGEARKETDPEGVAEYVSRELTGSDDDEALAAVRELLARPGGPLAIVEDIPSLHPWRAWFTRFLFKLQAEILPAPAVEVVSPAAGDGAHPASSSPAPAPGSPRRRSSR
jgi:hypothetical protein